MEKNLLIFVSVVLLNCASSYADDKSSLPPLPTALEVKDEGQNSLENSKSFWQKIKDYVGFGEKEKIAEQHPEALPVVKKTEDAKQPLTPSKMETNEQAIIDNKEIHNSSDAIPPIGSTEEGPVSVKLPEKPRDEVDDPDQLKLPDGFGEDVQDNSANSTSISESTQGITNLGEVAHKNKTDATSKDLDQPEDKTKVIKETAEQKPEEMSVPQLPQDTEDKAKDGVKIDPVKETVEQKPEEMSVPQLPQDTEDKAKDGVKIDPVKETVEQKPEKKTVVKDEPALALPAADTQNGASASSIPNITVPEYANTANQPNENEVAISKYKKEFEAKSSTTIVVPKISESELSLENKSKQVDLKASDLEEFDSKQLKFVNNEAQVLILPDDDLVLGVLTEEAKLDQMDLRSYIDKFWENYNRLKREPKRLEMERFIDNYDELFDTNTSPYEEK